MATLARQTRSVLLPALQSHLSRSLFAASLIPAIFHRVASPILPTVQSLLQLFPPIVLAVPKSKISHSRKSMRSANKGLKDKQNIVNCPGCGEPKLAHNICSNCYTFLSRIWKTKRKQGGGGDIPDLS
ncbi:hypothetical protein L208DRAFT_1245645 [Tricholoma matsutake]|nr:hypothetical protein L208DRAFT_1245645 [Tricholoma matsutake 945]